MEIKEEVDIYLPYDLGGKSVEQTAYSEEDVDWDSSNDKPKLICTSAYAVAELKHYLSQILPGISIRVRTTKEEFFGGIVVGDVETVTGRFNEAMNLEIPNKGQSFRLKLLKIKGFEALLICGTDRAGVLYGVYTFLDYLGVRWYGPEKWQEVIPHPEKLSLKSLDIAQTPSFDLFRGFHVDIPGKASTEMFIWMARNKLNFWNYQEAFYPLQRKLCFHLSGGGHTWEEYLHPEMKLENGKSLFDLHPEWFAEVKGKRSQREAGSYQFCVADEKARAFFLDKMIESLKTKYRGVDILGFWPYDSWSGWCECEKCQRLGNNTDRYLWMASQARRRIDEEYEKGTIARSVSLGLLAYGGTSTMEPPSKSLPAGLDTNKDSVTFFPIDRCYAHRIDDSHCQEINEYYQQIFKSWSDYPGLTCVGEYYNVSKFGDLPLLFYDTMQPDLQFYHRIGMRSINYMHVTLSNWGPRVLTNYLFGCLAWNVEIDSSKIVERFFEEYFEEISESMKEVFTLLKEACANVAAWRNWNKKSITSRLLNHHQDPEVKQIFIQKHLQYDREEEGIDSAISAVRGREVLEKARKILDTICTSELSDILRKRWEEFRELFGYGQLSYEFYLHMARLFEFDKEDNKSQALKEFKQVKTIADKLKSMEIQWPYDYPENISRTNALVKTQLQPVLEYYHSKYK